MYNRIIDCWERLYKVASKCWTKIKDTEIEQMKQMEHMLS